MENLTTSLSRTPLPLHGYINCLLVEDLTVSSCRSCWVDWDIAIIDDWLSTLWLGFFSLVENLLLCCHLRGSIDLLFQSQTALLGYVYIFDQGMYTTNAVLVHCQLLGGFGATVFCLHGLILFDQSLLLTLMLQSHFVVDAGVAVIIWGHCNFVADIKVELDVSATCVGHPRGEIVWSIALRLIFPLSRHRDSPLPCHRVS